MKRKFMFLMSPDDGQGGGSGAAQADIASRLGSPAGAFEGEPIEPIIPDNGDGGDGGDGGADLDPFKPSPYWDMVKDVEGFEMPAEVNAENEMDLLRPLVMKKFQIEAPDPTPITEKIHPYAARVLEIVESNPEASITDIAKQLSEATVDYTSMSPDELIRYDILKRYGAYDPQTNPDGLTDEEISDEISKMGKLHKRQMADNIKDSLKAESEQQKQEYQTKLQERREAARTEYLKELEKTTTDLFADMSKVSDIYGIKLGQSELKTYLQEFKEFSTPSPETGVRKLDEWLSNNQNLFKLFVISLKSGEDGMRELITKGREQAKEDIFRALALSPTLEGSGGKKMTIAGPEDIARRLGSPDGTF